MPAQMPGQAAQKPLVIVDPHFRKMAEVFAPADLERLRAVARVAWAKDEPMPLEEFAAALPEAEAIICSAWRYGNDLLEAAPKLRAILSVSGAFLLDLDEAKCYRRSIRVLSASPAFGPQVAEMALGMALACSREIALGDRAMRDGEEK